MPEMAGDPNAGLMNAPAGVDPLDYAKLMRQQQIASFLQQDALTPIQQTQPQSAVKGLYVQARTSPVAHLAKLAEALMAKRSLDQSNQGMAQAYAKGLQAFAPGGAPAPAPTGDTSVGTPSGYSGGAGASDAGQPGTQGRASTPVNPMNPFGQDPRALAMLYQTDKPKYLEMVRGTPEYQNMLAAAHGNHDVAQAMMAVKVSKDSQTTEWLNALNSTRTAENPQGDPARAAALLYAEAVKKGTTSNRGGEESLIPMGGVNADGSPKYLTIRTPNISPDQDFSRNPDYSVRETHLIPGAANAARTMQRAEKTGAAEGEIHDFETTGGGKRYSFGLPNDLSGAPGAPRQYYGPGVNVNAPGAGAPSSPATPAPQRPQYFPPAPGSGAPPPPQVGKDGSLVAPSGVTPGIWRNVPTRPSSNAIGVDPYAKGNVDKMVEENAELSKKYGSEADLADQRLAYNNEALKVLKDAGTGPMADTLNKLRKRAEEMGVSPSYLPGGDIDKTDELKKFLLRNPLLSLKPTFGGRPAASEFQILANDASPSPEMMKGAIQRLVELDNDAARFTKQRAQDYSFYHDQANGNPLRFESYYATKVPFAKWLDEHPSGAAAAASGPQATIVHNGVTYEKRDGQWQAK